MNNSTKANDEAAPLLLAHLLYEELPVISPQELRNRLAIAMPRAKLISKDAEAESLLIAHEDHVFEFQEGKAPAMTGILRGHRIDPARLDAAVGQTRDWGEASEIAGRALHSLVITEMMASVFKPQVRGSLFHDVLLQVLEIVRPLAIFCDHAERMVDPTRVLRASGAMHSLDRMAMFLNVRLFRITNGADGDVLMDTRGLAALRLPDLQMHFRGLEPGRVASLLYNSAMYIYEHGDCIEDGHTIQGLTPAQRWRCQHEESLVGPKRMVIDIDPGDPFAAGKRQR